MIPTGETVVNCAPEDFAISPFQSVCIFEKLPQVMAKGSLMML
jgi:hypothetical protein